MYIQTCAKLKYLLYKYVTIFYYMFQINCNFIKFIFVINISRKSKHKNQFYLCNILYDFWIVKDIVQKQIYVTDKRVKS